jgi:hypothetical protein
MKVFSYVVMSDSGFAPNPFHGTCTLACCKAQIRRSAAVGDLIVGLSTRSQGIVYAMRVGQRLSFDEYWRDPAFAPKRPAWGGRTEVERAGDNIYEPLGNGIYRQERSRHSNLDETENAGLKRVDLSGGGVLVAKEFIYFGCSPVQLPEAMKALAIGRNHRCRFSARQVEVVREWFDSQPRGVHGKPTKWPDGGESWQQDSAFVHRAEAGGRSTPAQPLAGSPAPPPAACGSTAPDRAGTPPRRRL